MESPISGEVGGGVGRISQAEDGAFQSLELSRASVLLHLTESNGAGGGDGAIARRSIRTLATIVIDEIGLDLVGDTTITGGITISGHRGIVGDFNSQLSGDITLGVLHACNSLLQSGLVSEEAEGGIGSLTILLVRKERTVIPKTGGLGRTRDNPVIGILVQADS